MAQRKKKVMKKKRHTASREPEADSDTGDFELAAEIKDDDSVRKTILILLLLITDLCVEMFDILTDYLIIKKVGNVSCVTRRCDAVGV